MRATPRLVWMLAAGTVACVGPTPELSLGSDQPMRPGWSLPELPPLGPPAADGGMEAAPPVDAAVSVHVEDQAGGYEDGHVFIANRGANDVIELDAELNPVGVHFADQGLSLPSGLAFASTRLLWVVDGGNSRLVALDPAGATVAAISTTTRLGPSLEGVYVGEDDELYAIANPGFGKIARYASAGAELPDVLFDPNLLFIAGLNLSLDRHVLISDFSGLGKGVRELDRDSGALLRAFGTNLGLQDDMMIDAADRVFVSHPGAHEIVVFDRERKELMRFTTPSSEPNPLSSPSGIALTRDCRILVAGSLSNALYEWRHRGNEPPEYLRSISVPGLSSPRSIAIAGLGLPGAPALRDATPACDELP